MVSGMVRVQVKISFYVRTAGDSASCAGSAPQLKRPVVGKLATLLLELANIGGPQPKQYHCNQQAYDENQHGSRAELVHQISHTKPGDQRTGFALTVKRGSLCTESAAEWYHRFRRLKMG